MSLSPLPLSYCTNVHPGRSLREVEEGLDRYAVPVMRAFGQALAAGLWLANGVVTELLSQPGNVERFSEGLLGRGLTCHTLNAFPFGDFHGERVKENVYLPDWSTAERLDYTVRCAEILAKLLPEDVDGSISTLPLGFREFPHAEDFTHRCAAKLIDCAEALARIYDETGKMIRLAIEPEPFCVVETTPQVIQFFRLLWNEPKCAGHLRAHLGLCFDVCHQAVEFEDVAESIRAIDAEGIRINKVHASCALQLDDPHDNADGRAALHRFVEPRYLHQTMSDRRARAVDLTRELIDSPGQDFASSSTWRVHFHVPVDAERIGPLKTTRPQLKEALRAVAKLSYAPHLEVETYTWDVLPGAEKPDLVTGLARELIATRALLAEVAGMNKIASP